ncbi:MAG TPA: glycosyltransferase family 4 protein [Terriglobia bacterium]|nr:glycosyltransferase family 4 protein [Terriglobia bacterium]
MNRTVLSVFDIQPLRIGGIEAYARELSTQLDQHGWKSALCFLTKPEEAVRCYLDRPNVTIEILENPSNLTRRAISDMARMMKRHRPDILHLHFTPFLGPYPWLAKLYSVDRIYFTDHWSRPAFYVPRRPSIWKWLAARAINFPMTGVVCVSDYGHKCMTASRMLPFERLRRVYNGVDLSCDATAAERKAYFRQKYSIPPDRSIIVQVSWIIPEKGIPDLLATARLVIMKNPKVHFVLVGEGAYREEYTREAARMGLGDYVTWTGMVLNPFTEGVYAAADVVCQFSNWEEAFGWSIAEAMASYKPVLATQVGAIPELVKDGESGFLTARGDTTAMAEKILLLLEDPGLREQMGRAGRLAVETKFDLKKNVAELLRMYEIDSTESH